MIVGELKKEKAREGRGESQGGKGGGRKVEKTGWLEKSGLMVGGQGRMKCRILERVAGIWMAGGEEGPVWIVVVTGKY